MPLAIELAAARVKLLSPDAILERLEHQLGVLSAGSRDLPERQQTLRGAIAWSHELLVAGERRLLARLSVFVGGCELDGAEAVCGPAAELDGVDVLDGLMSLADQSLVRAEEVDGATRFRMLDTIREFAAERLTESGERDEIERRHTVAFLALAEAALARLSGDDQRAGSGASSAITTTSGPSSTGRRGGRRRPRSVSGSRCGATGRSAATSRRPAAGSRRSPTAWSHDDPRAPGAADGGARRRRPGGRPTST